MLRGLLTSSVHNHVFGNLLAVGILVTGIVVGLGIPRESFPDTSLDYVVVTVPYPGASPTDVERSVCVEVEQAIEGIAGVRQVISFASEDTGRVFAEFDPSTAPALELIRQIQQRVNAITTFPEETEEPVVAEFIVRNQVMNIGVHGPASERTIKNVSQILRRKLLRHSGISQVSLSGVRDYEVSIRLSHESLSRYGLKLQHVIDAVARGSLDLPAGTILAAQEEINVRTLGQRYTAQDFRDLPVITLPDGTSVRLGQMAQVLDTFGETTVSGRVNGEPGAIVQVFKTNREDISTVADAARDSVETYRAQLPAGIRLSIWGDTSRDVEARLQMLSQNAAMGMALVILSLLLFVNLPSALAVALGIPVALAGSVAAIGLMGGTLNMISLLGLLMATGIIVDDAIVIADSVRSQARRGLVPDLAAVEGTRRMAIPVLASSATTIIAFIPLMFVEGVMGKLIYILPVVVISAVVASAIEAFLILPAHLQAWTAGGEDGGSQTSRRRRIRHCVDTWIDGFIVRRYRPALRYCLSARGFVLATAVAMFLACMGLVLGGRVPFVMFPKADSNLALARVQFPEGTPVAVTQAAVDGMERAAYSLNADAHLTPATPGKLVQQVHAVVGEWAGFVPERSSALGEVSLELMPAELRRVDIAEVINRWRESVGTIPGAQTLTVTRQEHGPTAKPVEIRLLGEEIEPLRRAANELRVKLASYDGVFDAEISLRPGKRELQVLPKPGGRALGVTVAELAAQLRHSLHGQEAVRVRRGQNEVKAVVSYADSDRQSPGTFDSLRIRSSAGAEIPLQEVADTTLARGYAKITRQDGLRRVRVQADVDERSANGERIVQHLVADFLPELAKRYPGVTYVIDGQHSRIAESLKSLARAGAIAAVAMFALLGTTLRSYTQPIVIMVAIPLAIIGAVLGHAVLGYDLTLMSVFGMTALAGIVVNDSLVLVDRVRLNMAEGMNVRDAVLDAGQSRFRAVAVTSITTIAGLFPLLIERSAQAQSLIPMAVSIAFGLVFATVLVLLVVPVLFLIVDDSKRFMFWLWNGSVVPDDMDSQGGGQAHSVPTDALPQTPQAC
ncbi:MAG: efflux RND transporter permease subunit [Phycisphaerales bacterium]|nr:MAG: efflux RND transporter permease subunit [Phycisphaerales bacterium]